MVIYIIKYLAENLGLFIGIIETLIGVVSQILKFAAGIANITTHTRRDDELVNAIETFFEGKIIPVFQRVKEFLYQFSEK